MLWKVPAQTTARYLPNNVAPYRTSRRDARRLPAAAATGTDGATPVSLSDDPQQTTATATAVKNGNGSQSHNGSLATSNSDSAASVPVNETVMDEVDQKLAQIREARIKGYEGEACQECGNFTLVRNGTCMKCDTCGSTSGCS